MADLNYVSPLTSDLTDYYTKTEVDELQQGDENRFATQAQITAGDNEVKGWVASQGYLTQHQSLQNYATKEYVDNAIEDIEVEGGVKIRVVSNLPANPEENVIYLTHRADEEDDNIYNEWIWVADTEDFELIGDTSTGVIPDLTNYATKSYVDTAVAGKADEADIPDVSGFVDGSELSEVAFTGDYDDLSNKPTIPSLTGYATTTYVDDAVGAVVVPDISGLATEQYVDDAVAAIDTSDFATAQDIAGLEAEIALKQDASTLATVATSGSYNDLSDKPTIPAAPDLSSYATKSELSAKANAVDLATVATSGSYNDLSNKPTIPSTSGLASETYVDNAIAAIKGSDIDNDMNWIDEGMAKASAIDEINNNVSAAGLSGDYDDLTNKPTIPTVPTNVSSFTNDAGYLTSHQDISGKANIADLATVATSGDYDDLTNKPTIPSITGLATETYVDNAVAGISVPANTSDLTNDSGFITSSDLPDTSGFVESSDLATVATTGDYDDLTNKPTIPVLPTLATVATSGSYNDLSDKPTIPQDTGITSAAGALPLAFIGMNDTQTYCNISRLSNNQDRVKAFNSGYLCMIAANDGIALTPEEAILPGSDNTSRFRSYILNNNGTHSTTNNTLSNGQYYIYGRCFVQRISPNAYIQWFDSTANPATFYKALLLSYSNTASGLTATTFQEAIDELAAASGGGASTAAQLSYDNTNTWNDGTDTDTVQEAIDALYADVDGLDIPDAVGYTYDSSTHTVSLSGVLDNNL